jgi:signal peptidase I
VLIRPESWPGGADVPALKRVVGLGGDRVSGGADGAVEIDGRAVAEEYVVRDGAQDAPVFEVTVPAGTVFVAGDVRDDSVDSRVFVGGDLGGAFPLDAVLGTVVAVDGEAVAPTTAFTDAGLPGAAYPDSASGSCSCSSAARSSRSPGSPGSPSRSSVGAPTPW